jgi:exosome complex component RRP45
MLYFSVDISPMAATSFVHAAAVTTAPRGANSGGNTFLPPLHDVHQKLLSNRILRTLERVVLTSGVMDLEAFCVVSGQWVWKLQVSVTVLDMGGNLLDAAVFSCMAALSHYRQPQVSLVDGGGGGTNTNTTATASPTLISPDFQQATPLPLHHIPLTISFGLVPVSAEGGSSSSSQTVTPSKHSASSSASSVVAWMDPSDREELVTTGTLTIAMNVHGEVCWLDVHGCELPPSKLRECGQVAQPAIVKLCGFLEESLQKAEEQAQRDRLQRLQRQQQQQQQQEPSLQSLQLPNTDPLTLPPLPPSADIQVPFWQGISEVDVGLESAAAIAEMGLPQQKYQQEEEYRNMALDYALGHVAAKVKENRTAEQSSTPSSASSLLAALLKSAQAAQSTVAPAAETAGGSTEQGVASMDTVSPTTAGSASVTTKHEISAAATSATTGLVAAASTVSGLDDDDDDDDDDEEPTTMEWQSEFVAASSTANPHQDPPQPIDTTATKDTATSRPMDKEDVNGKDADDDVDDLAMAIKKKSRKKKSNK